MGFAGWLERRTNALIYLRLLFVLFCLEVSELFGVLFARRYVQRLLVVVFVFFARQIGRLHALLEYGHPVERLKPFVLFDVVHAVLKIADAFRQVDLEQILEQVFEVHAEVRWKTEMT